MNGGPRTTLRSFPFPRVTWQGVTATYRPREHHLMQQLREAGASRDELATLHTLIGLFDARLDERAHPLTVRSERAA